MTAETATLRRTTVSGEGIGAGGDVTERGFYDPVTANWTIKVPMGKFYLTTRADEVIVTVLGSCVSACIRDVQTERELLAAFERHGVKRIDPKGERFDHNFHQAIFEAERPGAPTGTVIEVLQPGYVLHDRLLRPAMVGVAKAPAKSGEGTDDAA